jgi:hypothetical protein
MSEISYSTCEHEARHAVACWSIGRRRPTSVCVGVHATDEGVMHSEWDDGRGLTAGDLIVSLVGWLNDPDLPPRAVWPEPWPVRRDAPEGVGLIVHNLRMTREAYEGLCGIAEELVEDPYFREATELVARALMIAPSIDAECLEVLRQATAFGDFEAVAA